MPFTQRPTTKSAGDSLEAHFNVRAYLKLLAVNQTMQNWDTYGAMTHNYYLYGDPDDNGRLL